MALTCTRCEGTGFLNLFQIDEIEPGRLFYLDSPEAIGEWMGTHENHDVQVCDCCGDGENWHGTPGEHSSSDYGRYGPYAYNGGLPECY